jgi:hypothetical protein
MRWFLLALRTSPRGRLMTSDSYVSRNTAAPYVRPLWMARKGFIPARPKLRPGFMGVHIESLISLGVFHEWKLAISTDNLSKGGER